MIQPPQVTVETIGPAEAKALLEHNTRNRAPKDLRWRAMARDITANRWMLNGESIKIADDGTVLDGQNRLMAVVVADKPIQTIVVRGLPIEAQDTIDIGVPRSYRDILDLRGEMSTTALAAAVSLAWRLETNGDPNIGRESPTHVAWADYRELDEYLRENPGIRESVRVGAVTRKSPVRYPQSIASALHYLFAKRSRDLSDTFFQSLGDGQDLVLGDPVYALRNFLLRDLPAKRRMDLPYRAAVTIKTWNAMRDGRAMYSIRWSRDGGEDFPAIR